MPDSIFLLSQSPLTPFETHKYLNMTNKAYSILLILLITSGCSSLTRKGWYSEIGIGSSWTLANQAYREIDRDTGHKNYEEELTVNEHSFQVNARYGYGFSEKFILVFPFQISKVSNLGLGAMFYQKPNYPTIYYEILIPISLYAPSGDAGYSASPYNGIGASFGIGYVLNRRLSLLGNISIGRQGYGSYNADAIQTLFNLYDTYYEGESTTISFGLTTNLLLY